MEDGEEENDCVLAMLTASETLPNCGLKTALRVAILVLSRNK